jgi:hypothetical protein
MRGQLDAASRMYEQTLQEMEGIDPGDPSYLLYRLADLQLAQGRVKQARLHVDHAIEATHGESAEPLSTALIVSGEVSEAEDNLAAARQAFNRSLQIRQALGDSVLIAEAQAELAELTLLDGQPSSAENQIRQALAQFEKADSGPDIVSGYTTLSRALLMQGKVDGSREAAQHAVGLIRNMTDPALRLSATVQAAAAQIAGTDQKTIDSGRQQLHVAIATAKKLGYRQLEVESRLELGKCELKSNEASGRAALVALASEAHDLGLLQIERQARQALSVAGTVAHQSPAH